MTDETNVNYVAEMAKKFKKEDGSLDVEALARGKYESDNRYVPQLEQELAELREDLKKRETLDQVVAKIKAMKQEEASSQVTNPPVEPLAPVTPTISSTDVTEMVRQTLASERAKAQKDSNVSTVNQELTKAWGTGFQTRVNAKAEELGIDAQFLESMKATHPQAFLKLVMDSPQRAPDAYQAPRGSYTPSAPGTQVKNWAYWQKLRKENPSYYHSIEGARERDRLAIAMGDRFFE